MKKKFILLHVDHRYSLVIFKRIADLICEKDIKFKFLIGTELNKEKEIIKFLKKYKIEFQVFPNVRRNLYNYFFDFVKFKYFVFKIDKRWPIILFDKSDIESRVFLKKFKKVILLQRLEKKTLHKLNFVKTIYNYIKSFFFGAEYVNIYTIPSSNNQINYIKLLNKKIKKRIIIQTNNLKIKQSFWLPTLDLKSKKKKKIVFFGSRFYEWKFLKGPEGKKIVYKIFKIYEAIYLKYKKKFKFYYIPHPREVGNEFKHINQIFFGKIINLKNNYVSSEHFLYENRDIYKTFSIGSTSSLSSYQFGYDSKVFYKMLNLDFGIEKAYDDLFSDMPKNFFSKNPRSLFLKCVLKNKGNMKILKKNILKIIN
jgi:hypothetical protein